MIERFINNQQCTAYTENYSFGNSQFIVDFKNSLVNIEKFPIKFVPTVQRKNPSDAALYIEHRSVSYVAMIEIFMKIYTFLSSIIIFDKEETWAPIPPYVLCGTNWVYGGFIDNIFSSVTICRYLRRFLFTV